MVLESAPQTLTSGIELVAATAPAAAPALSSARRATAGPRDDAGDFPSVPLVMMFLSQGSAIRYRSKLWQSPRAAKAVAAAVGVPRKGLMRRISFNHLPQPRGLGRKPWYSRWSIIAKIVAWSH